MIVSCVADDPSQHPSAARMSTATIFLIIRPSCAVSSLRQVTPLQRCRDEITKILNSPQAAGDQGLAFLADNAFGHPARSIDLCIPVTRPWSSRTAGSRLIPG